MNRISLLFAVLVAASFAAPTSTHVADVPSGKVEGKKSTAQTAHDILIQDAHGFLQHFLEQKAPGVPTRMEVLFATVPNPTETHLASAFDHNVVAIQEALQDSDYTFDSSWIPWSLHRQRDAFDDDVKEKQAKDAEDTGPGILLFRHSDQADKSPDEHATGLVVFLITEKPTTGVEMAQFKSARQLLTQLEIPNPPTLRLLGPSFSGSFGSLVPAVEYLQSEFSVRDIRIRSGGVTGGVAATGAMSRLSGQMQGVQLDFGSALHNFPEWIDMAEQTLERIGIDHEHTVLLSEDESLYGSLYDAAPSEHPESGASAKGKLKTSGISGLWSLTFPRDISSLRVSYDQQGLFDNMAPAQPWKHVLNLKSQDETEGDTIRTFGGPDTMAMQESVLLGISEFLKKHEIRAVVISATNEEDRYFLSKFLHTNNGSVRVMVISNTRLFMRGPTSEFRGDLVIDSYPMLPLLHDWTRGNRNYDNGAGAATEGEDRTARIFPDDVSQGVYIAGLDLVAHPKPIVSTIEGPSRAIPLQAYQWVSEYSTPSWSSAAEVNPPRRPPMYVTALGGNEGWPLALKTDGHLLKSSEATAGNPNRWKTELPFTLFADKPNVNPALSAHAIEVSRFWKMIFVAVILLVVMHCYFFWYANPITRIFCASFEPSLHWRFWTFKVVVPAMLSCAAFLLLARAIQMPLAASVEAVNLWHTAQILAALGPLAIGGSAVLKAVLSTQYSWSRMMTFSFAPTVLGAVLACLNAAYLRDPFSSYKAAQILDSFRRMHWESGLSLLPTSLLLLCGLMLWCHQMGLGAAILMITPKILDLPLNRRVSQPAADRTVAIACPVPLSRQAMTFWIVWTLLAVGVFAMVRYYPSFRVITTLEPHHATRLVLFTMGGVVALLLLDILQFLWIWDSLRTLLRVLDRQTFKRSFVPIKGFDWKGIWSFSGVSFRDQNAMLSAQIDCVESLPSAGVPSIDDDMKCLHDLRVTYNTTPLTEINTLEFRRDLADVYLKIARIGTYFIERVRPVVDVPLTQSSEGQVVVSALQGKDACKEMRFSDEAREINLLSATDQAAECLVCLMYISFTQTIIARLHGLMISITALFSLLALSVAIYPFTPIFAFLSAGVLLLGLIAWAFFHVFSQMDTDPILARIVNGDDRKLAWSFYGKVAESLALPLITLASSFLPGGTARLLDVARTFLDHAQ